MAKRLLSTQRIVNLAADPATGTAGEMYFNTTSSRLRYHNGTSWIDFASLPQSIPYSSSAPSNATTGMLWVDSSGDTPMLKSYNGTSWITLGSQVDSDQNIIAMQVFR